MTTREMISLPVSPLLLLPLLLQNASAASKLKTSHNEVLVSDIGIAVHHPRGTLDRRKYRHLQHD